MLQKLAKLNMKDDSSDCFCCILAQINRYIAPYFADPLVRLSFPLDSRYFIQYDEDNKALRHYHVMPDPDDGTMYLYSYAMAQEEETNDEQTSGKGGAKGKNKATGSEESRNEVIRKLPFTIPELVQRSPYPSHDGILYTGKRSLLLLRQATSI